MDIWFEYKTNELNRHVTNVHCQVNARVVAVVNFLWSPHNELQARSCSSFNCVARLEHK